MSFEPPARSARWLVCLLFAGLVACSQPEAPLTDSEIELNNRGVGLMGQYRNEEARVIFAQLAEERPDWLEARVNEAIATLNRQEEGDELRALAIVTEVLEQDPQHHRALYVAGLMYFYLGDSESAQRFFQRLLDDGVSNAHVHYFAAEVLSQTGQLEQAVAEYQQAIAIDPYLRSAYYGAALILRQLGRMDEAREHIATYQRFANNPRAHLAEFRYTRMGVLAEALAVGRDEPDRPKTETEGPLFAESRRIMALDLDAGQLSLTTADLNDNGLQDLFLAGGPGQANVVLVQDNGGFVAIEDHPLAGIDDVTAAGWADFDNSGATGVYLCRSGRNLLLDGHQNQWSAAAGSEDVDDAGRCADLAIFDADHDGDVDIFVVNADADNELLNNNLNGTWRRLSEEGELDLSGPAGGSRQVLAVDLDGNRIVDILVLNQRPPHQAWINDRLWQYRPAEGLDSLLQTPVIAIGSADFNADGRSELVSLEADGSLRLWRFQADGQWRDQKLARIDLAAPDSAALATLDLDGNGRADILAHHADGFEVWQLAPEDDFSASRLHAESVPLLAMTPIIIDPAQGPALAAVVREDEGTALAIWPAGQGRHAFMAIRPSGRSDRGEGMRSNASGIGTHMLVRSASRWSIFEAYDQHSAPGQSLQPVAIGLGQHGRADFVRFHWTDGVLQTEMDLVAGKTHDVAEVQRQLASCPVLFAWNGERYDFVSDLLGVAGIGFFLEPGVYSEPRPWEYFKFPPGSIAPRDGRYKIKIAEPMEEIAYIDTARLHIHDLPPGWSMSVDERMHTGGGPEPTGDPIFYRQSDVLHPARAMSQYSGDVTDILAEANLSAVPPGERHPHFLGRLVDEHVLTLEFDQIVNPDGRQPVLVANGWVEYPYSQTLFSAWQADASYTPPSLEAFADGQWVMVYKQFGYPAGMPREMALPLADLPPETTRLRLRGNWEVYWDHIRLVYPEAPPENLVSHSLAIDKARLAKTGFARRDTLDQRLPYYDYNDRSPFWDTKYPRGFYTALGPVEALVERANNAFAIVGPGEELHLEFAAPASAPDNFKRVVVLEVRGFAKDMDLYTRDGETVEPMPYAESIGNREQREQLHRQFNTRYQGGF